MRDALKPEQLRKTYDPQQLNTTAAPPSKQLVKALIGQDRAKKALRFGLGNRAPGFNVYASGKPGDGILEAVQHLLVELAQKEKSPKDWCYVNNFQDAYCPNKLSFPPGGARIFKAEIKALIEEVLPLLQQAFNSKAFAKSKTKIQDGLRQKQQQQGEEALQQELEEQIKLELKIIGPEVKELEQKVASIVLEPLLEVLIKKYKEEAPVIQFLTAVKKDIYDNLGSFMEPDVKQFFHRYEVNIIVDNVILEGAPIVAEANPTYASLFGKIEKEAQMGALVSDFTLIRPGALHKANGGYLIIPVEPLLEDTLAWESLKRALITKQLNIEDHSGPFGFISTNSLQPQAIPLNIQVILIGRPYYYYQLYDYDDDFSDLFKVKADFDDSMLPSLDNIQGYIGFVSQLCQQEQLHPVDASALAQILEYGHRVAESQKYLSTRFNAISDLIREANYYVIDENASLIGKRHIQKTIEERVYRTGLYQEKYHEWISDGTIILDLEGSVIGQINGLTVVDLGDAAFGHPTRITASISVGKGGVLDIEREAKLGGSLHTKGVLILSGYISELFGQDKPLSLTAQIVFEQSYGYIEGDSASSAELYALLSALAQVPLKQQIAVTGSVNQKGFIQAVGGINEKIEGFFELCQQIGLTGEQGVLIPASNVQHLMLKEELIQSVAAGQFHIWAIETIQEGIEILTGIKAGNYHMDTDTGAFVFEEDSIFDRINKKMIEMTLIDLNYGKEEEEE